MTEAVLTAPEKKYRFTTFVGKTILKLGGWRLDDRLTRIPKMVVIFAPHTTNWDFVYMLSAAFALGLQPSWMGKKELFWGPFGWVMRKLGGISIDRSEAQNTVEMSAAEIVQRDETILGIAPEATRSKAGYWRSGFYHIARLAKVPVSFGYLDYPTKTAGIVDGFLPSGDMAADLEIIRAFYQEKRGKYPEKMGEIRFKPST